MARRQRKNEYQPRLKDFNLNLILTCNIYNTVESVSGQDKANPVFRLATRAGHNNTTKDKELG